MEREQIRTALATKLMGWTLSPNGYWWQDRHGVCVQHAGELWRPDEDWKQCGMVIEAMQARGWCVSIIWASNVTVIFDRGTIVDYAMVEGATLAGVCYATCVAATRALEATNDEQG